MVPTGQKLRQLATLPGSGDPVLVQPVVPVVAEFLVDVAIERGRLRHPARFSGRRLELDPGAVELVSPRVRSSRTTGADRDRYPAVRTRRTPR